MSGNGGPTTNIRPRRFSGWQRLIRRQPLAFTISAQVFSRSLVSSHSECGRGNAKILSPQSGPIADMAVEFYDFLEVIDRFIPFTARFR
jgi:hypothetical protein